MRDWNSLPGFIVEAGILKRFMNIHYLFIIALIRIFVKKYLIFYFIYFHCDYTQLPFHLGQHTESTSCFPFQDVLFYCIFLPVILNKSLCHHVCHQFMLVMINKHLVDQYETYCLSRWLTCSSYVDYDTVAGADKFGNVFVVSMSLT